MTAAPDPAENHLLRALAGDVLHYVCFPVDCIVSLLHVLADGATAQGRV